MGESTSGLEAHFIRLASRDSPDRTCAKPTLPYDLRTETEANERRCDFVLFRGRILVNDPALHHKDHASNGGDIFQGIAVERNNVRL